MTATEKRDRRKAKHEAQKIVKKNLSVRFRLDATPNQIRAEVKKGADILLKRLTESIIE